MTATEPTTEARLRALNRELIRALIRALGDLIEPPLTGNPRQQQAHARQRARSVLERCAQEEA